MLACMAHVNQCTIGNSLTSPKKAGLQVHVVSHASMPCVRAQKEL